MKTKQRKLLLEEAGKFCIDIAKFVITGAIVTVLLTDLGNQHFLVYIVGSVLATLLIFVGFYLLKRKED